MSSKKLFTLSMVLMVTVGVCLAACPTADLAGTEGYTYDHLYQAYQHLYEIMDNYETGNVMRLIESYEVTPTQQDGMIAWVYDNALALIALCANGTSNDLDRAKVLADTFVWLINNEDDAAYSLDGGLRDGYSAEDIDMHISTNLGQPVGRYEFGWNVWSDPEIDIEVTNFVSEINGNGNAMEVVMNNTKNAPSYVFKAIDEVDIPDNAGYYTVEFWCRDVSNAGIVKVEVWLINETENPPDFNIYTTYWTAIITPNETWQKFILTSADFYHTDNWSLDFATQMNKIQFGYSTGAPINNVEMGTHIFDLDNLVLTSSQGYDPISLDNFDTDSRGHIIRGYSAGNMAWAMIALLDFYEKHGNTLPAGVDYLNAAKKLGHFVYDKCYDERGSGGYTGGFIWNWWTKQPSEIFKWKSTEHNIDLFVAYTRLCEATNHPVWLDRATHAKNFVEAMWNQNGGYFWVGTTDDGVTPNLTFIPEDVQSWSLLALGDTAKYGTSLEIVEELMYTTDNSFEGFDYSYNDPPQYPPPYQDNRDGVWFEGTCHMALAYLLRSQSGDPERYEKYLGEVRRAQNSTLLNSNNRGIVAASRDFLTTQGGNFYHDQLHVGATSWFIFAELKYNPFWGIWGCWRFPCFEYGDYDGDGFITYNEDVLPLINAWGNYYDPCCDKNMDGNITFVDDVQPLIDNWATGCP